MGCGHETSSHSPSPHPPPIGMSFPAPSSLSLSIHSYGVMLLCWKHNPENRPPFETLVEEISALLPENYIAQHVEMPIGSPNEEDNYIIMENPRNSAGEEDNSVSSYATPPNSPFLTSDYSVSQHEGSIALSIGSCQVDDNFASDSEYSDVESGFSKSIVRNKSSFRTPSSNLASVSTLVPEHGDEIQIGSMEFLSTISCLSNTLTETLANSESNIYVNHNRGLSAAPSRAGSRAGSAFGSYMEMKPVDTSHT